MRYRYDIGTLVEGEALDYYYVLTDEISINAWWFDERWIFVVNVNSIDEGETILL